MELDASCLNVTISLCRRSRRTKTIQRKTSLQAFGEGVQRFKSAVKYPHGEVTPG